MKHPIDLKRNATFSNLWKQIFLIILFGCYAAWMEWKSFDNVDFSDLVWLGAVLILSIIIRSSFLKQKSLSPVLWVALGTLCWSIWRFSNWIFISREGIIIGSIGLLTFPIYWIFESEMGPAELTMRGLTIIVILLSIWGTYWVYRNFDIRWLRKSTIYWGLLLAVVVIVTVYSGQPHFKDNCFGVNSLSESLSCRLRDNLGVIGSIWVSLTFFLWALTFGFKQAGSNGMLANLWLVALEPVWIAMFFNPTRILGVILLKVIRSLGDYPLLAEILTANMRALNLIPIAAFFILIPIGLLLLKSEKLRVWWTISMSTITFAIMLGVLFQALDIARSVFSYSTSDRVVFVLMALQVWLPLIIVSLVGYKLSTQVFGTTVAG